MCCRPILLVLCTVICFCQANDYEDRFQNDVQYSIECDVQMDSLTCLFIDDIELRTCLTTTMAYLIWFVAVYIGAKSVRMTVTQRQHAHTRVVRCQKLTRLPRCAPQCHYQSIDTLKCERLVNMGEYRPRPIRWELWSDRIVSMYDAQKSFVGYYRERSLPI